MICPNCGNEVADFMKFCQRCGAQMMTTPSYAPPAQPSWSPAPQVSYAQPQQKSGVGKVLLIIGVLLVLLVVGVGAAIFFGVRSYLRTTKSSEAYALAESTLRESPIAKERLGEIKNIGIPLGTHKEESDGSGYAVFTMGVEGEKTGGQYVATLTRIRSVWQVQRAVIKLTSGEEVNISPKLGSGAPYETDIGGANQNTEPPPPVSNSNGKSKTISGGVLNGKAVSLPEPAYPAAAKAARAEGTVVVQVTIDEAGKVTSAKAVSGHPLLQAAAVAAARQAVFTPTKLSGQPVKVTGVINYNFKLE